MDEFNPFIYALVDPFDAGHVRYVGMSTRFVSRPLHHAKNALKASFSGPLLDWIRGLQTEGRQYSVLTLETLPVNCSAQFVGFVEACYISSLRQIGHQLLNTAKGGRGNGFAGRKHTDSARALMRAAWTKERRIKVHGDRWL